MSFPSAPINGQITVVNGITYIYSDTESSWTRSTVAITPNYTASPLRPATPTYGDFWYQTTTDILFQYLTDGTNSYWFDVQTQPNTSTAINPTPTTLSPFLLAGM